MVKPAMAAAVLGSLLALGPRAQSVDAPRPKFEVASVKPCTQDPDRGAGRRGASGSLGDPGMFRTP